MRLSHVLLVGLLAVVVAVDAQVPPPRPPRAAGQKSGAAGPPAGAPGGRGPPKPSGQNRGAAGPPGGPPPSPRKGPVVNPFRKGDPKNKPPAPRTPPPGSKATSTDKPTEGTQDRFDAKKEAMLKRSRETKTAERGAQKRSGGGWGRKLFGGVGSDNSAVKKALEKLGKKGYQQNEDAGGARPQKRSFFQNLQKKLGQQAAAFNNARGQRESGL